jgi:hypothetical protein
MDDSEAMGVEVYVKRVEDGDVEAFYQHQADPQATRMAAFPAREREAFAAHWATLRADPAIITQTIVAAGQVAGNVVSWDQSDERLVGYWIGRQFWGRGSRGPAQVRCSRASRMPSPTRTTPVTRSRTALTDGRVRRSAMRTAKTA